MTELKFPWRRTEIASVLQDLANPLFQWEKWVERKNLNPNLIEGFSTVSDFMLDDNTLADNADLYLGVILKTQEEVDTMHNLAKSMVAVIEAVGKSKTDRDYITHPLWSDVLFAAREALDAFTRAEYGYPIKKQDEKRA